MAHVDPTLEALWAQVVDDWDDDERHGKLLAYAQQTKQLGEAAALYRRVTQPDSPYRVSENQILDAKKRLLGVATLAVMDLDAQRSEPVNRKHQWAVRVAAAIVMFAMLGAAGYLLLRH